MNQFICAIQYFFPDGVKGTSRQLLDIVNDLLWEEAPAGSRPAGKWPASARQVSLIIREHTDDLRAAGWTVEQEGTRRPIRWHLVPPAEEEPRAEVVPRGVAENLVIKTELSAEDVQEHLEEKLEEIKQRYEESRQAEIKATLTKLVASVAHLEGAQAGNFEHVQNRLQDQDDTLEYYVDALETKLEHVVKQGEATKGSLEALDKRISELTEGVVALIAEAEAGAKARLELIEKLEERQDEALRELNRLSRPWWKRRGKK